MNKDQFSLDFETSYAIINTLEQSYLKDEEYNILLFKDIGQARSWLSKNYFDSTLYPTKYRIVNYSEGG